MAYFDDIIKLNHVQELGTAGFAAFLGSCFFVEPKGLTEGSVSGAKCLSVTIF